MYLLGTSLARPVISRGMIAVADREGCECVLVFFLWKLEVNLVTTASSRMDAQGRETIRSGLNSHSMVSSPILRSSHPGVNLVSTSLISANYYSYRPTTRILQSFRRPSSTPRLRHSKQYSRAANGCQALVNGREPLPYLVRGRHPRRSECYSPH